MRAARFEHYGPPEVVLVVDVPDPTPGDDELLVRVVATAVNASDSRIRDARFPKGFAAFARLAFGVSKPRNGILGSCFSGVVEAVGAKVTAFAPGDQVCGMTGNRMRAHAELLTIKATKSVVRKPAGISHDDAAGVLFGGTTALYFLRDRLDVATGQRVLVVGTSGAVGTNAVQIAKHLGATVTGVTSTPNLDLVKSLGADTVIDYRTENLLDRPERYDVVIDAVGVLSIADGTSLLADDGKLALVAADLLQMLKPSRKVVTGTSLERAEGVTYLLDLLERGALTVVIDSTYPLEDIVEAHRRADSGRKVGNIVVHPVGT